MTGGWTVSLGGRISLVRTRGPARGLRRAMAASGVVAVVVAGLVVTTTDGPVVGVSALPGATADPTGPTGGPGGDGGLNGGQFQPPQMPSPPGGYNGGSYPQPGQSDYGVDINSPAAQAPEYSQAPPYPQQAGPQQQQPAHGTQPPNYDAPLQQQPSAAQQPSAPQTAAPQQQPQPNQTPQETQAPSQLPEQQPSQQPRMTNEPTNAPSQSAAPTQERDPSRQRIRKVTCDLNNPGDCRPDDAPRKMKQCETDPAVPDTALIIVFYGMGGVTLTCGDYFHILREHFQQNVTDEDRTNFLQCVSKTLFSGQEWERAKPPNIGRKFQNPTTGVWGYVSVRPDKTISTALTSGDGKEALHR